MIPLVAVGLALGLDSFQVSLGAGLLKLSYSRQVALALAFGLSDGIATLAGLAMSRSLADDLSSLTGFLGTAVIGVYGLYLIMVARYRSTTHDDSERELRFMTLGLPICLSIDNWAVGIGLGMLHFPLFVSTAILASMSAALSFAGVKLGRTLGNHLPFRAEIGSGIVLLVVATLRVAQ
jgi:putative Mn2+ efflux pump MntP